jgi:hypothetical protein
MEELAEGQYVRYRSSEDMISEIEFLTGQYPRMKHIYLEIETVGADIVKGIDLFEKLAAYKNAREEKLSLMGVTGETFKDYLETLRVVRDLQPEDVQLSIFYPYIGSDLYNVAVEQGVISAGWTEPSNERHRATLELENFPKWQVQFECLYFWYRSCKGHWSADKIILKMVRAFLLRLTNRSAIARYLIVNNRLCKYIFNTYMDGPKKITGKKEDSIGTMASYHAGEL